MYEDALKEGAAKLGASLDADQIQKFRIYLKTLLLWNKRSNLTSITNEDEVITKHFFDSLATLKAFSISSQSIIDIGAGGGFPGVPIKIARPGVSLTLVDSVRKKTEFLKHLISILSLSGVDVVWGRAEDAAVALREKFDISLSRAVAPLNILVEYSFPFLKVGGSMISLKGAEIQKEIDSCAEALKTLGGEIVSEVKVNIPGTDIVRSIVVIDKTRKTPEGFPRRAGMAKKRPL